ncbi:MAG: nicotinate-nucleotide adenylyltransferase [Actinomycetota bacterium]
MPDRSLGVSDSTPWPEGIDHSPRRVGVFGGTFDPPHVGHLVTAVNVLHEVGLDVVLLMVNNVPWQKDGTRDITPAEDRFAMVAAAVEQVPGLQPGHHEIELGGASYTADTLGVLADEFPDAELFTIVGDDAAAGLATWERHEEVVARSRLVVVDRPGEPVSLDDEIDWIRVEVPRLEVSSTDLRARFTDGRPLDYLVTNPVLRVIEARGLYGVAGDGDGDGDDEVGAPVGAPQSQPVVSS